MRIIFLAISVLLFPAACMNFNENNNLFPDKHNNPYPGEVILGSNDQLIVLLHGIYGQSNDLNTLQTKLKKAFPEHTVVSLNSVEIKGTYTLSISEQARLCFKELSEKIPNLNRKSILLIGHSQGGLRAYELYTQYKDKLQVKGIVTLATPWEGAPGLHLDETSFNELLFLQHTVQLDIQKLCKELGTSAWKFNAHLGSYYNKYQLVGTTPGGRDLIPDSKFLLRIKNALSNETIRILAVGAGQSDFSALLDKDITPFSKVLNFQSLNDTYAEFIVGKTYDTKSHDMLVPLDSQHGVNIFPKGKQNFKKYLVKDASHNGRALDYYPISKSKGISILEHEDMVQEVIAFSKDIFKPYARVAEAA